MLFRVSRKSKGEQLFALILCLILDSCVMMLLYSYYLISLYTQLSIASCKKQECSTWNNAFSLFSFQDLKALIQCLQTMKSTSKDIWQGTTVCDCCHRKIQGILCNERLDDGTEEVLCNSCHLAYRDRSSSFQLFQQEDPSSDTFTLAEDTRTSFF